ncbi:hypothetical protein ACIRQF_30280 [Streptomyces sp. NPDC101191]|uniref:hypothetical protein n=1 Tax=Streptomyces sp. NPDC101191 TaxID=3366126 RepID=UPI0037FE7777
MAEELAARLRAVGCGVEVERRHIDRPILRWPDSRNSPLMKRPLDGGHTARSPRS